MWPFRHADVREEERHLKVMRQQLLAQDTVVISNIAEQRSRKVNSLWKKLETVADCGRLVKGGTVNRMCDVFHCVSTVWDNWSQGPARKEGMNRLPHLPPRRIPLRKTPFQKYMYHAMLPCLSSSSKSSNPQGFAKVWLQTQLQGLQKSSWPVGSGLDNLTKYTTYTFKIDKGALWAKPFRSYALSPTRLLPSKSCFVMSTKFH